MYIDQQILLLLFVLFYVFNMLFCISVKKPNNLYYSILRSFLLFINTYYIILGKLLTATISLTLFNIEIILV